MTENNPYFDFIKVDDVEKVLKIDKGNDVKFISHTILDFAGNVVTFNSSITSVEVLYSLHNAPGKVSYIVKMNPRLPNGYAGYSELLFLKEVKFYEDLVPLLNTELLAVNEPPLKVPRCYFTKLEPSREAMYLEDLRVQQYTMFDKTKGLDKQHTEMGLAELARFHAASVLLMAKEDLSLEGLREKYPTMQEVFYTFNGKESAIQLNEVLHNVIDDAAKVAGASTGYEEVSKVLRTKQVNIRHLFDEEMQAREPFIVMNHGDLWTNNFLYRQVVYKLYKVMNRM